MLFLNVSTVTVIFCIERKLKQPYMYFPCLFLVSMTAQKDAAESSAAKLEDEKVS